jgi:hypothetical protein
MSCCGSVSGSYPVLPSGFKQLRCHEEAVSTSSVPLPPRHSPVQSAPFRKHIVLTSQQAARAEWYPTDRIAERRATLEVTGSNLGPEICYCS